MYSVKYVICLSVGEVKQQLVAFSGAKSLLFHVPHPFKGTVKAPRCIYHQGVVTPWCIHHQGAIPW